MRSWEAIIGKYLRALRLERISSKLVAFAVLATLIPSLSTAWVSYIQNKRSLSDKITGELQSISSEAQREIDLWLKERLYDLRVFASSYEVTENLARAVGPERRAPRRLIDYLSSVRERFADYEALVVVDRDGRVVASNPARLNGFTLPSTWSKDISIGNPTIGDVYWDQAAGKAIEVVAVPIRHSGGRLLGAFAAKLNLRGVDHILKRLAPSPMGALYVITKDGRVVTSSAAGSTKPMSTALPAATTRSLIKNTGEMTEYRGLDQSRVVGTLRSAVRLNWSVVAEVPVAEAYRQAIRLRNETALIVLALLLGVGLLGYALGLIIVRPLNRLTTGAALVAKGNLDVEMPVTSGGGEVGYLTEVFNNMVDRLRESRDELERLSVTDPLTKLHNRRYLMDALAGEVSRCRRHRHSATVLMVDVDNFKKYNDAFGHLAGDEVLQRVAAALQASIREVDCAARYGGEEFIVVLSETGIEGAQSVTDRVRERLATEVFQGGKITVSIGVAEFPTNGDTPEALLRSADAAMYDAKGQGRNRVARATAPKKRA